MQAGTKPSSSSPLRILAVSAQWQGANDYAFVRAFRRAGHSVRVVSESEFIPAWRSTVLRGLRRAIQQNLVREFNNALLAESAQLRPDLLFVFKGAYVKADTLRQIRLSGTICIQFYPDVSFYTHGKLLPESLPNYDWVFTTKTFGLDDMEARLGITDASFLPHGFDPETHIPCHVTKRDRPFYTCDISFIGNWSPKKQEALEHVLSELSDRSLKIWGPDTWSRAGQPLNEAFQSQSVLGLEYSKAIQLSKINIALLSERRHGASAGDQITSRTFHIPASGGFMMHERTGEAMRYFEEGMECAFFSDADELVKKIRHYLAHEDERTAIAEAGRRRCLDSGYSVDDRARVVIEKYHDLCAKRGERQNLD